MPISNRELLMRGLNRERQQAYADIEKRRQAALNPPQQQPQEETEVLDSTLNALSNFPSLFRANLGAGFEMVGDVADSLRPENPNHLASKALGKVSEAFHGAGDYLREGADDVKPDYSTMPSAFISGMQQGGEGVVSGLASILKADKSAEKLNSYAQKLADPQAISFNQRESLADYFLNPHGFAQNFGQIFGSMGPGIVAAPEATVGAAVLRKFGGDALIRVLLGTGENAARRGIAKFAANHLPSAVSYGLAATPIESMAEGGHVRMENLAQGLSDAEATANAYKTVALNAPGLFISNLIERALMRPFGRGTKAFSPISALKQIGGRSVVSGFQQGIEEAMQNAISSYYTGKEFGINPLNWSDEQWREFWDAYIAGMFFGGAGGAVSSVKPQSQEEADLQSGANNNYSTKEYGDIYATVKRDLDRRDAQSQANVDRYTPSDNYTGENGQAEGKYWERNPNMGVSFEGAQPELMNAIDKLAKYYYENTGKRLVINAGTNGRHADGEHSHAAGWKVDVVDAGGSDVSMSEDGPLFTAGYDKGPFLDEFIAYGRSLGLGMNLENLGTGNVHLDIALDGTQWDGNGEHAGGFNSSNRGQVSEQNFEEIADDPNFTEKQNEIWREAQYVAAEAKKRYGYDIKPEWIYGQWSHEAGVNFDSPNARYNNNFGGLTQVEFNGEENKQPDGGNYYRTFKTPREYSEAYLNDFLRYYDGMKNVTNSDEFVQVLKDNDYFGGDLNIYKDAVREFSGKTPQTRMKTPSTSRTPSISMPQTESTESTEYKDETEDEYKPIKFADDEETQNLFDEFAKGQRDSENENLFAGIFDKDDNFINTQENRDAVQKEFGEDFDKFLQSKGYKLSEGETTPKIKSQLQQPQEQPKPQQGQVEFEGIKSPPKKYLGSEFEKLGTVEKIRAIRDWASESGSVKLMSDASTIENSGDKQAQEKFVRDNPLPKDFVERWEKENAEENSETSILETPAQEKSTAENKKSKVEIPAKLLEIARAKVDMDNSNARIRQGEALLKIANLNKFKVDKTLERMAKNGYKKAVPQLKALLEEQGFLNDGKETAADKHKKIRSEYEAKQKELDEAYRAVKEIPADTIDIKARRTAYRNFDRLLNERNATREKFWESTRQVNEEWRQNRNAPKSDYRKAEWDYQNEVAELTEETEKARQKVEKLFKMGDFTARAKALKEFQSLQKQLDDKIAERDKFMVSDDHEQDLIAEYEFADDKRKKAILNELIELGQRKSNQNSNESPIFTPKPRKSSGKPSKPERIIDTAESYENEIFERTKRENANRQAEERKQNEIDKDAKRIFDGLLADEVSSQSNAEELENQRRRTQEQQQAERLARAKNITIPNYDDNSDAFGENRGGTESYQGDYIDAIKAATQETKPQKIETPPPTSKKTYHFDGTKSEQQEITPAENISETQEISRTPEQETSTAPNEKISEVEETPKKSESKIKSRPAGKSEKILTDSQKPVETHYKVVSADELIPSHEWNGDAVFENKNYPADEKLQPRESRKGSAMTVNAIKRANNLNPELLTDSKNVNQGAPLVRGDGVVLNGNGRILSINRAYKNGKADGYKKHLIDNAEKFGLNAEEISKIENPVLIREVNQELTPELTNEIINSKTGGESFNDTELAREDAKKISFKPIKNYVEGGTLDDLYYDVASEIIPESERNRYFKDGGLTTSGLNCAKNALFAKAYGEKGLLDDISNSGEEFSQNLQDALLESAAHIIQANKKSPNYRIGEVVSDAAKKYVELKKAKKNVAKYINEERETDSMFDAQRAAELDIIEEINDKVGNKNQLRSFFRDIANKIIAENDKNSELFENEEADKRVDEIVADAKKKSAESQGQNLFKVDGKIKDTAITKAMYVADKDLTPQQKKFVDWGKAIGMPIQFFKGEENFGGMLGKDGVSYFNVNYHGNLDEVFWHEATHWLGNYRPDFLREIIDATGITYSQLRAKRNSVKVYENLTAEQLEEEILADNMRDLTTRGETFQQVGKENPSLAEKFVSYLKTMLDNFLSHFKKDLTRTQRENMRKAFAKNVRSITDAKGNKQFRVSNLTHEIQHIDGTPIEKFSLQLFSDLVDNGSENIDNRAIEKMTDRTLFARYVLPNSRRLLSSGIKVDVARVKRAGKEIDRDKLPTINNLIDQFNATPDNDANIRNREMLAAQIEYARRLFENDYGGIVRSSTENGGNNSSDRRGATSFNAESQRNTRGEGKGIAENLQGKRALIVDGEKDDAKNLWREMFDTEKAHQIEIRKPKHSEKNRSAFSMNRYSIDPSDNSNEGWKRKIRQAASWVWNGTEYDTRIRHRITQKIDKATGFKTRFLKRRSKDPAMVDEFHKIMRLETAYDFENLLPMTGKYIAEKLNLQPSEKMNNYIAEWIWDGASTNSSEESRLFEKAMRENPEMAETLVSLQEDFQTWNNMTALERAKAIIVQGGKKKQWRGLKNLKKVFTTAVTDDLDALEKMKQEIEERTGEKIEINLDPHKNAALVRGSGGIAESLISAETPEEADYALAELKQKYKNVNFDGVKPVQQIISEISGAEKVDDFLSFWLAKYYKELHEKNGKIKASAEEHRQKLRDKIDNLEEKISQLENKREKNKIQKELDKTRKELDDYESKLFKTGLSESECDNIIEQFQEEFGQAEQDIVRFCNAILDIQADSGLVTKKTAERWESENKHYAPMTYVFDEADKLTWSDSTMHREGSTRDAVSMLETLLRNTSRCIRAAEVNKFKLNLAHLARAGTIGEILSEEEVKNSAEPFISFKENGKVKYLATTPDIKAAVDSLTGSQTQSNFVLAGIKAVANIFRATVTSANPMFAAGNPIRDSQEAYLYNRNGSLNPYHILKNIAKAYWNVIHAGLRGLGAGRLHPYFNRDLLKENPNYKKFLVSGGSQATMLSNDIDQIDDYLKNITRTNFQKFFGVKGEGGWTRTKGFVKQLVRTLQEVSEITETTTRLKVFEHNLERYGAKRENGIATYEDERQAALDARNATTDFAKGGTASKFFNQYIPFFNPTIQGLAKDANLLKDCAKVHTKEGRTLLKNTIARIVFGTVSMALAQSLYRLAFGKDDDDDEYGTNDWKKNTNWIFGSLSIPKSYSLLQRFFGVAFEDLFAKIFDGRNVKNDRYRKIISEALPSIMPVVVGTGLEAWTNYSFFYGGPIVPQKEEGISAYKQYGHKTSELAKWLGGSSLATFLSEVFLGKSGGISPRRIDYVMKDFGFLDTVINGTINKFVKSLRGEDTSLSATEFPVLNRFMFNPIKNPQIVIDYYNAKSEQEQLDRDYKDNKKRGIKELPEGYDPQLYRRIKSIEKAMERISEQEEKIRDNLKLPKEEAQRQIDELNRRRIQLCKTVFGYN